MGEYNPFDKYKQQDSKGDYNPFDKYKKRTAKMVKVPERPSDLTTAALTTGSFTLNTFITAIDWLDGIVSGIPSAAILEARSLYDTATKNATDIRVRNVEHRAKGEKEEVEYRAGVGLKKLGGAVVRPLPQMFGVGELPAEGGEVTEALGMKGGTWGNKALGTLYDLATRPTTYMGIGAGKEALRGLSTVLSKEGRRWAATKTADFASKELAREGVKDGVGAMKYIQTFGKESLDDGVQELANLSAKELKHKGSEILLKTADAIARERGQKFLIPEIKAMTKAGTFPAQYIDKGGVKFLGNNIRAFGKEFLTGEQIGKGGKKVASFIVNPLEAIGVTKAASKVANVIGLPKATAYITQRGKWIAGSLDKYAIKYRDTMGENTYKFLSTSERQMLKFGYEVPLKRIAEEHSNILDGLTTYTHLRGKINGEETGAMVLKAVENKEIYSKLPKEAQALTDKVRLVLDELYTLDNDNLLKSASPEVKARLLGKNNALSYVTDYIPHRYKNGTRAQLLARVVPVIYGEGGEDLLTVAEKNQLLDALEGTLKKEDVLRNAGNKRKIFESAFEEAESATSRMAANRLSPAQARKLYAVTLEDAEQLLLNPETDLLKVIGNRMHYTAQVKARAEFIKRGLKEGFISGGTGAITATAREAEVAGAKAAIAKTTERATERAFKYVYKWQDSIDGKLASINKKLEAVAKKDAKLEKELFLSINAIKNIQGDTTSIIKQLHRLLELPANAGRKDIQEAVLSLKNEIVGLSEELELALPNAKDIKEATAIWHKLADLIDPKNTRFKPATDKIQKMLSTYENKIRILSDQDIQSISDLTNSIKETKAQLKSGWTKLAEPSVRIETEASLKMLKEQLREARLGTLGREMTEEIAGLEKKLKNAEDLQLALKNTDKKFEAKLKKHNMTLQNYTGNFEEERILKEGYDKLSKQIDDINKWFDNPSLTELPLGKGSVFTPAEHKRLVRSSIDIIGTSPVAPAGVGTAPKFGNRQMVYQPSGMFAGWWIDPDLKMSFDNISKSSAIPNSELENWFLRSWDYILGSLRTTFTVLRPAYLAGNELSNWVMLHLALGMDAANPILRKKGRDVLSGKDGFLIDEFGKSVSYKQLRKEIDELAVKNTAFQKIDVLSATSSWARRKNWTVGDWIEFGLPGSQGFAGARVGAEVAMKQENRARTFGYISARLKGMSPESAAMVINRALVDYSNLSPFEQKWMRRLPLFYTWFRRTTPELVRFSLQNPVQLATWTRLVNSSQRELKEKYGLTNPEIRGVKGDLVIGGDGDKIVTMPLTAYPFQRFINIVSSTGKPFRVLEEINDSLNPALQVLISEKGGNAKKVSALWTKFPALKEALQATFDPKTQTWSVPESRWAVFNLAIAGMGQGVEGWLKAFKEDKEWEALKRQARYVPYEQTLYEIRQRAKYELPKWKGKQKEFLTPEEQALERTK